MKINKDALIKECQKIIDEIGNTSFDMALPEFQRRIWDVAEKYNITGPEACRIYFDWKSKQGNN